MNWKRIAAVPRRAGFAAAAIAGILAATAPSAFAQLNRVGPVGPLGYPAWYQDKTGLTLEFCDNQTQAELQGGWCVLLPPDLATGAAPETRTGTPVNFADEHFYYLVNAGAAGVTVTGQTTPAFKALLVAGIEGAFGGGPVKAGDEMVFARLRIRVDPVPFSGTYTVYTPFGKRVFEDQVAGDRLFATDDVGLTPGNFTEALNGSIHPFLVPSATPGGAELPPVSAANPAPDTNPLHFGGGAPTAYPNNGRRYIGDPARIGPITGSKANFTADGIGDPHLFRIDVDGPDVPRGHMTIFTTVDFTVTGRIFEGAMPGDVNIQRASYSRGAAAGDKVDLFATASPITKGRIPSEPVTPPIPSNLVYYNAACIPTLDAAGNPGAPYHAPTTGAKVALLNSGETFFAQYGVLPAGLDGCLEANATTTSGQATTVYTPIHLSDQIAISEASYDAASQTLTVKATSSDATLKADGTTSLQTLTATGFGNLANGQLVANTVLAPPATIAVTSSGGGSNTRQVTTGVPTVSTGGTTPPTTPPQQPVAPIATNVSAATIEGQPTTFALTNDTTLTVVLVTNGVLGNAVVNGTSVTYTPNPFASGNDAFAYQLTKAGLVSNTATVTVAIAPVNNPPTAVAETMSAIAGFANSFNLLGNDTDPDGLSDLSTIVIESSDPRLGNVTVSGGIATFTPQPLPNGVASADLRLSYHAVDSRLNASAPVFDTVRVFASETITPSRWQYTISQGRWVVTGTVSPAQAQTMTVTYASGSYNVWNPNTNKFACTGDVAVGQPIIIGRAVTDTTATWTLDQGGTAAGSMQNPTNSNHDAVSPDGKTKTSFWCTTPTLRIASSTTGASVTTSAVQVK